MSTVQHELSLPRVEPEIFTALARELGFVPDQARRPATPPAPPAPPSPPAPAALVTDLLPPPAVASLPLEVTAAFEAYRMTWHAAEADETVSGDPAAEAWTAIEPGAAPPPLPVLPLPLPVDVAPPAPPAPTAPATPAVQVAPAARVVPVAAVRAVRTAAPASRRTLPSLPPIARGEG